MDYGAPGKDGGIDLAQSRDMVSDVVECKHVADCELATVADAWDDVADKLGRHLAKPEGPTKGQSQYRPWYNSAFPINRYVFCTNAVPKNDAQAQGFRARLGAYFPDLASVEGREHLEHLKKTTTEVWFWLDFVRELVTHPDLRFRWFPNSRPIHLIPFDEKLDNSSFRAYLHKDRLPHYSIVEHAEVNPFPPGEAAFDEDTLIAELECGQRMGIVITGAGGYGKTRLMVELGHRALDKGWIVLRADEDLDPTSIIDLASNVPKDKMALILFDYIETQKNFDEIARRLEEINKRDGYRFRYIANCRSSYYHQITHRSDHRWVDLSKPALEDWLRLYRRRTVEHILQRAKIYVAPNVYRRLSNVPVLAVFLYHLKVEARLNDEADPLRPLLQEEKFGDWVRMRLERSLGQALPEDERERLAQLMTMLPLPAALLDDPENFPFATLIKGLKRDGWIEEQTREPGSDEQELRAIHDVVADQLLLSYLSESGTDVLSFLRTLLRVGRRHGQLNRVLRALARIGNEAEVSAVNWWRLFSGDLDRAATDWQSAVPALLRLPLLSIDQKVELLDRHGAAWNDALGSTSVQDALGTFARYLLDGGTVVDSATPERLRVWFCQASGQIGESNYLLTYGLQLFPDELRTPALAWFKRYPLDEQTHYLLVAWIKAIDDLPCVQDAVVRWLKGNTDSQKASFVYKSWLDAGGDFAAVSHLMLAWLGQRPTALEAAYVYGSWVKAGGDFAAVSHLMLAWLGQRATALEAAYVYGAWVKAGGDFAAVSDLMLAWLGQRATALEAAYVFAYWFEAGGAFNPIKKSILTWHARFFLKPEAGYPNKFLAQEANIPVQTAREIFYWCQELYDIKDAFYRMSHLKPKWFSDELQIEFSRTISAVYGRLHDDQHQLDAELNELIVTNTFSIAVYCKNNRFVQRPFFEAFISSLKMEKAWSIETANSVDGGAKSLHFIFIMLQSGALDLNSEREHLRRFARWVNLWAPEQKRDLDVVLSQLRRYHPAPDIWDLIHIDD